GPCARPPNPHTTNPGLAYHYTLTNLSRYLQMAAPRYRYPRKFRHNLRNNQYARHYESSFDIQDVTQRRKLHTKNLPPRFCVHVVYLIVYLKLPHQSVMDCIPFPASCFVRNDRIVILRRDTWGTLAVWNNCIRNTCARIREKEYRQDWAT